LGNFSRKENRAMSTRERWIVYPLLFLTLGIALREKATYPHQFRAAEIAAQQIQCERLLAGGILCEQEQITQTARVRQIVCDSLVVNGPSGRPAIQLQSAEGNGVITALDRQGNAMMMGYLDKGFGVFAQLPGTGVMVPLTQTWRFERKIPPPKSPREQGPGSTSTPTMQPPEKKKGPAEKK
jgi:hypothetical protein